MYGRQWLCPNQVNYHGAITIFEQPAPHTLDTGLQPINAFLANIGQAPLDLVSVISRVITRV